MGRVKDAAESLNTCLRKLVEAQDDQPTPTVDSGQDHTLESAHNQPSGDGPPATPGYVTTVKLRLFVCVQISLSAVLSGSDSHSPWAKFRVSSSLIHYDLCFLYPGFFLMGCVPQFEKIAHKRVHYYYYFKSSV